MIRPDLRRIWLDLRRVQVGVASAVGSAAERCWGRQPLELKRGSRGGSPWERKAGVRGRQPLGKKSGGLGAAAPGIEDYSFIADTFTLF